MAARIVPSPFTFDNETIGEIRDLLKKLHAWTRALVFLTVVLGVLTAVLVLRTYQVGV